MPESMSVERKQLTLRDHALVLAVYTVLTVIYFAAYVRNLHGFNGSGDDALFANAFWWFNKSLFEFKNPFFSDALFFPDGMNLVFHTSTYSNFLLTLPLQWLSGVDVAVNGAFLSGFILAGYCCFLLVYEVTGSFGGSIVSGIIFSFSPFHFSQGRGHLHISTLQWLPLYFLCLKRSLENGKAFWAAATGLVMGLVILTDQLQTICLALITMGLLAAAARRQALAQGARQVGIIAVTAGICSSFYLYPLLRELASGRAATRVAPLEHGGANMYSADLLGFFLPGFHRYWGGLFSGFNLGPDSVVYPGYIALALAAIGVWSYRRDRIVRWTLVTGLCFWLMSLGTYLHVNGVWEFGTLRIPLPYLAMIDIPLLGENRTPCRFHMITVLAVAILAGYGVKALAARIASPSRYRVAVTLLVALILVETMPPRQEPGTTAVPELFTALGKESEKYSVLQLPLSRWSALLRNGAGSPMIMMYYQTVHGKPIFGGLASRLQSEDLEFKHPILNQLVSLSNYDSQLARDKTRAAPALYEDIRLKGLALSPVRTAFINYFRIGAIVLHPPLSGDTLSRAFLESFLGMPLQTDPASGIAYVRTN